MEITLLPCHSTLIGWRCRMKMSLPPGYTTWGGRAGRGKKILQEDDGGVDRDERSHEDVSKKKKMKIRSDYLNY